MTTGVAIGGPAGAAEHSPTLPGEGHLRASGIPVVFGPVRSRRLGWSLGIDNVPSKTCSYACVYCQVGATTRARVRRAAYLDPGVLADRVRRRVEACREAGQPVDYATFVPDGEPTLDLHAGEAIRAIRAPDLRVAVITNSSLLWREDVREDLLAADWVSLKVDTVDHRTWRTLNRPVRRLDLAVVLAGVRRFVEEFHGYLATETMLVAGMNDDEQNVRRVADFVRSLGPSRAYLAVPVRPPTEAWVRRPSADTALRAAEVFAEAGLPTTLLSGDQDEAGFAQSADAVDGLIGILAVHPMTERAAREYITRSEGDWQTIEELISGGVIARIERDSCAYLRVDHAHLAPSDGPRRSVPGRAGGDAPTA
jgi:wyosine [tRNA(Phe)-imidazoG37] synthetase (radical SAM superfamily)